jgi:hypothetical protein
VNSNKEEAAIYTFIRAHFISCAAMPLPAKQQVSIENIKKLARQFSAVSRVQDRVTEGKSVILDVKGANFAKPTVENLRDHVAELGHMMRLMHELEKRRRAQKDDEKDDVLTLPLPTKPTLVAFLKELLKTLGIRVNKQWLGNTAWDLKRFCSQLRSYACRAPKKGKKIAYPNVEISAKTPSRTILKSTSVANP